MNLQEVVSVVDAKVREMNNIDMDDTDLSYSTNLLEEGYIDSMGLIKLVTEIEDHFRMKFSNADFLRTDFATIEGISSIIDGKLSADSF